jgi:hypothetical protein
LTVDEQSLIIAEPEPLAASRAATDSREDRANTSIVTRLTFDVSPEEVWEVLSFYEQLAERPPLYLRLLLPVPVRIEGKKSEVGDEAVCVYDRGQLVKRVTEVDRARALGFVVSSQELAVGGGMRLAGGKYTLRALPHGRTELALSTRYASQRRPRWLWRPIEAAVCHLFHRYMLRAMRREAEARRRSKRVEESG